MWLQKLRQEGQKQVNIKVELKWLSDTELWIQPVQMVASEQAEKLT